MLADQARFDDDDQDNETFGGDGDVTLTEDNADQFINYINNISRGQ